MIIKRLVLQNFKSFKERTEIDLDLSQAADGKRVVLIGGMNGGGKTTVLEAVNFCLYGARNEEIYERINRSNLRAGNGNVMLELCLENDDGREVVVRRNWQSNGRPRFDARDLKETLSVTVDGERRGSESLEDFIDQTIPRGISQFFFFDGEKIRYMASDVDTEGKLKSAMESVLGIEIVRRLHDDLKFLYSEDKRKDQGISNQDVKLKAAELEKFTFEVEKLRKDKAEAIEELKELENDKSKKDAEFNKYFGFPPELSEKKKEFQRQLDRAELELENISKDVKAICGDTLPYVLLADLFPSLKQQLELEKTLKKTAALQEVSEQLAEHLMKILFEPKCIACNREVPHPMHSGLKARIGVGVSKVIHKDKATSDGKAVMGLSEAQELELANLIRQIEKDAGRNLQPLIERREKLERQQGELKRKLGELTVSPADKKRFDALNQERENIVQNIGRKKQEIRSLDVEISKAEAAKSSTEREYRDVLSQFDDVKENSAYLKLCQSASKAVDEYIEELRKTKVAELASNVFEMYRSLATHGDMTQEIRIDPDTFQVSLVDKKGHIIPKETLAEGQKEIFAISLLWGLGATMDYELPIIIDTPLARLDSEHRENIVKEYFPKAGVQVIILSTDTEIDKEYFEILTPCVSKSMRLVFDKAREATRVETGYFWRK
jgi:DNA sulfur modification protein DndD